MEFIIIIIAACLIVGFYMLMFLIVRKRFASKGIENPTDSQLSNEIKRYTPFVSILLIGVIVLFSVIYLKVPVPSTSFYILVASVILFPLIEVGIKTRMR